MSREPFITLECSSSAIPSRCSDTDDTPQLPPKLGASQARFKFPLEWAVNVWCLNTSADPSPTDQAETRVSLTCLSRHDSGTTWQGLPYLGRIKIREHFWRRKELAWVLDSHPGIMEKTSRPSSYTWTGRGKPLSSTTRGEHILYKVSSPYIHQRWYKLA